MKTFPKSIGLLGLEIGAGAYIVAGIAGSPGDAAPPQGMYLSVWTSLLFGAALVACLHGIAGIRPQPEQVPAPQEDAAESQPAA